MFKPTKNIGPDQYEEELRNYCQKLYTERTKKQKNIKPAFDYQNYQNSDSIFDGADNYLDPLITEFRQKLINLTDNEKSYCLLSLPQSSFLEIERFHGDDQTLIVINSDGDLYTMSWYKHRGRTELFTDINSVSPISLNDFAELYITIIEGNYPSII
jgi:hypothetical protein